MACDIFIVWPDAELAGGLQEALLGSGLGATTHWVERYPTFDELEKQLDSVERVVAVVVGLDDRERAASILMALRLQRPGVLAVAAAGDISASALREAMRAGAADYLAPPFDEQDLKRCFAAASNSKPAQGSGLIVGFVPAKGADGASMIASHVAQTIAKDLGQALLLVDCDFYSSTMAFRLGIVPSNTIVDAIGHLGSIDELWKRLAVQRDGLDMLVGPDRDYNLSEAEMGSLGQILEAAARAYPYVIADLPATLLASGRKAVQACDVTYLVCSPDLVSLHLTRRKVESLAALGIEGSRLQLVVNRQGSKAQVSLKEIEQITGLEIAAWVPNDYSAVSDATMKGGVVDRESKIGIQLYRLACKVAGYEEPDAAKQSPNWTKLLGFG